MDFFDIIPYIFWSLQMWYALRLLQILLQQIGAEGLYYKTKKEWCYEVN